ncbi:hypothetical protein Dvina_01435 [Dactylosporangium vinaceum]|uniref:Uncharacterized protein n=1 Tax=Dactylosporangium vinaceum TaxID=53362 RepID=A0ABV5MLM5_9ACTN|nr:hypothetical protein [Dactylosporangium vinaceum]UAB96921.1 hypothetical protein Dvina_01435 [Dactylosporangium vinaceum]
MPTVQGDRGPQRKPAPKPPASDPLTSALIAVIVLCVLAVVVVIVVELAAGGSPRLTVGALGAFAGVLAATTKLVRHVRR